MLIQENMIPTFQNAIEPWRTVPKSGNLTSQVPSDGKNRKCLFHLPTKLNYTQNFQRDADIFENVQIMSLLWNVQYNDRLLQNSQNDDMF